MSAASTGGARPPAILFDWDNTLIDSWPIIHAANNAAMKAMGLPEWTFDQTKTRVRKSMRDAYPEIFGDRWEEAGEVFYAHYRTHHLDELRSITGIEDMLSALKDAGIYMGVVSNKTGPLLRAEAAHLGWDQYFGAIVGAGDAAKDKPAPDPIFQSAEPGGYDPSQGNWADIWYVGDTEIDMICAANSGLIPILLRQTPAADGEFGGCPPELVFTAGGDLCRFLDLLEN